MRIDRLTIRNFNGFESCEIEFDHHFNLLVGDNASGKSSVLDALAILLDVWIRGICEMKMESGVHPDYVRVRAFQHQDSYTFEKQFPVRIEASAAVMDEMLNWATGRLNTRKETAYIEADRLMEIARDATKKVMKGNPVILPLICSYGTERLWFEIRHRKKVPSKGAEERSEPSRLDGYEDCNEFEIQETELLSWIRAQVVDGIQKGQMTMAFRAMERAVIACVEGATALSYSERYKDAVVEMRSIGQQFFRNLSDGQRVMLTLIGDLVRRATYLNPDFGDRVLELTPGVVLIDELDLHLHPKWQRRIIHDLKRTFPSLQFITTTHSPQLIGEVLPSEIRILEGGRAYEPSRSFGLDSSRILEEIQGATQRNPDVGSLIHAIAMAIDKEEFERARMLILDLQEKVGPDDAEVTRARSLLKFMEAPR